MGLWVNQILLGYSNKLCATIALVYLEGRTGLLVKEFVALGVYVYPVVASRVVSSTKDARI